MSSVSRKSVKKAARIASKIEVIVSIDRSGNVSVSEDPIVVRARGGQQIVWKLDPESAQHWRLDGIRWCRKPPPVHEFDGWRRQQKEIRVNNRNVTKGEWRYGILYNKADAETHAPSMEFDPMIRNLPPR